MTDTQTASNDIRYELVADTDAYPSEPPLRLVRRVLRGRYALAALLAAVLAALGGMLAYSAVPPVYESSGLVRIDGALPAILYESQENKAPPMFDAFVASQVTFVQSRHILETAVTSPEMQNVGWPQGTDGVVALQNALTVHRGHGEQVISVGVRHSNPTLAHTAVNSLLAAFESKSTSPEGLSRAAKEEALVAREHGLQTELLSIRERMLMDSDQYGVEAFRRIALAKVEELMAIDRKLAELDFARSRLENGATDAGDLSVPNMLATDDAEAARLERQQVALRAEIETLGAKYAPAHPMIRELTRQLESMHMQSDIRRQTVAELSPGGMADPMDAADIQRATLARLEAVRARYEEVRGPVLAQATRLGRQQAAIAGLSEREDELQARISETRRRIDELRVEGMRDDFDRVTIVAHGDFPVAPVSDRRRGLAAAGILFGLIAGPGLVFLLGLCDSRARYLDELELVDTPAPILGLLPDLGRPHRFNEQRAGRTVHQLRNYLEVQRENPNHNVVAITSSDRGEGKTSLSLATASSFAAASRKTLVIDADIAHHSLTSALGLEKMPGLCEAIGPESEGGQVHATDRPNLWAMPIGSTLTLDPEDLSRDKLTFLFNALRTRFDIILIDTGPVLTSVEACLVSAIANRTIMVVERNQDRGLIQSALLRLEQIGAPCTGLVFNRARHSDFRHQEHSVTTATTPIVPFVTTPTGPLETAEVSALSEAVQRQSGRGEREKPGIAHAA